MTPDPRMAEIRDWATDDSPGLLDEFYERYGIDKVKPVHRPSEFTDDSSYWEEVYDPSWDRRGM